MLYYNIALRLISKSKVTWNPNHSAALFQRHRKQTGANVYLSISQGGWYLGNISYLVYYVCQIDENKHSGNTLIQWKTGDSLLICTHVQFTYVPMYNLPMYPCTIYLCTHVQFTYVPMNNLPMYNVKFTYVPMYILPMYPCTIYLCTHVQFTYVPMYNLPTYPCTIYPCTIYLCTMYNLPMYPCTIYLCTHGYLANLLDCLRHHRNLSSY